MSRVITYIDGFNLYFGLKSGNLRRFYWLDVEQLSQRLLRPGQTLQAVNYFTSRVVPTAQDPRQARAQSVYLDALATLPRTTLHFGHFLSKQKTCLACRGAWTLYEEKMTDVNIAVEFAWPMGSRTASTPPSSFRATAILPGHSTRFVNFFPPNASS